MSFETLKTAIDNALADNGIGAIQADVHRPILKNVVDVVGSLQFKGVASPSTNPNVTDSEVYYFASQNGLYANFNGLQIIDELAIFSRIDSSWEKHSLLDLSDLGGGSGDAHNFDGVFKQPTVGAHYSGTTASEFISLFFPTSPPTVSLSSTAFGYFEKGATITNPTLKSTAVLGANPNGTLTSLRWFRVITGEDIEVGNQANPTPGTEYTVADTINITEYQQYRVLISDSELRHSEHLGSCVPIDPFYIGVVDEDTDVFEAITRAELNALGGLQILAVAKSNKTHSASPTNARFCIGYPAGYGDLASIIDNNGFETIDDYNKHYYHVETLAGDSADYVFFILKSDTTQTNFTNTYKF